MTIVAKDSARKNGFTTSPSTYVVTILRLALVLLPHWLPLDSIFPNNWLYSSAFTSVLVRPHQTLSQVREARAILQLSGGKFSDAYNIFPTIRIQPLILASMLPVLEIPNAELILSLLLLLIDFAIAYMLEAIGRQVLMSPNQNIDQEENEQRQLPEAIRPQSAHIFPIYRSYDGSEDPKPLFSMESLPFLAARLYYWSPLVAMPGAIYHCYQNLPAFFMVASLYEAYREYGSYPLSTFYLAVASYMEPHCIVFLAPLIAMAQQRSDSTNTQRSMVVCFALWSACLQYLSYSLVGPSKYWDTLVTTWCSWKNLSPSLSLHWYFHMQLFSRFINYFRALLTGLPFMVVFPLMIRLHKYPMVIVSAVLLAKKEWRSVWISYANLLMFPCLPATHH